MKKIILFLSLGLLLNAQVLADNNCWLVIENNKVIKQEGDCKLRHIPCSTFKIAISLMGYNEGFLIDETHPELPFRKGYDDYLDVWKQAYNPNLWMKNSCIWYSRLITKNMGIKKFKNYLTKFNYGNKDASGDKGQDNGITNAWLSSSLEISPEEQIVFLQNLLDNKLPVGTKAQEMTKKLLFIEDLPGGWKLWGKSGSGNKLNYNRTQKVDLKLGWFIGWIQKDNRTIIFTHYIEDDNKQDTYAGQRAKAAAKEKLLQLIEHEQK